MEQQTIFDVLYPKFKIDKPIRLIEMFAGYGSQALALKYLGVKFEHWKICEWAVKSIQAYKDIHFTDDKEVEATFKLLNVDYLKEEHKPAWKRTPKFVRWLKENNISYNEFAKLVGVHKTTVCRWANKQTTPNADYRRKITEVMKNYKGGKK